RAELEHVDRAAERHSGARSFEGRAEAERARQQRRRYGRAAALRGDRDDRLAARRDNDDLRRRDDQEEAGERNHPRRVRMRRASSRSSARRFRSSRLSCSFFALASAIATLAMPSLKYNSSGTMVSPLRLVPPISLRISCPWSSSLRERAGGGLL